MPARRSDTRNQLEATLFEAAHRLFHGLSFSVAERVGRGLGILYRLLDGRRRRLSHENISRAFPALGPEQVRSLSRRVFAHFGGLAVVLVRALDETAEQIRSHVEVVGGERARAAAASGRGLFLVTPHLGSWELAALATPPYAGPATVVARPLDNPLLEARLKAFREKTGNSVVSKREAAREILRVLRRGGSVGILPDQRARPPEAILVPFLGRPAMTTTAVARFCARMGALVLPTLCVRMGPDRWRLEYLPVLDIRTLPQEEQGIEAFTIRLNGLVEEMVRHHPDQWLWLHDRWRR